MTSPAERPHQAPARDVNPNGRKLLPAALCSAVVGFVVLLHWVSHHFDGFDFIRRLEWMTYDWRARQALRFSAPAAPNLGFVFISDETIDEVLSGRLGYSAGLYWPRHVYGRVVQELDRQGAEAIAFDILFADLRRDHSPAEFPDGTTLPSDDFFAQQLQQSHRVILAAQNGVVPPEKFRNSAWAIGDIGAKPEADGILRRARVFTDHLLWHPMILEAARRFDGVRLETNQILFPSQREGVVRIPIDESGTFDQGTLYNLCNEALGVQKTFPAGAKRTAKAYVRHRVWNLGLTMAARYLKLDLTNALVEPGNQVTLRGPGGKERTIPIDSEGRFLIDWSLPINDPRLTLESFHSLLHQHQAGLLGRTNESTRLWGNKLVLVGSVASGNDLTDLGSTPLSRETYLTSSFWNIANSLILGRFITQPNAAVDLSLILLLGFSAGLLTWNVRTLIAAGCVLLLASLYVGVALWLYVQARCWLPLVLPCGSLFLAHFMLISWRAVFEQRERRRIRNVFAKIVSPNVVTELLSAKKLSLGGARRHVTILFSDVRGFTEMTDESHAQAEQHVREMKLDGALAEAYLEEQAQEVLSTVNLYLGTIADTVKKHDGTLDKYIGDCVMAFWGAPTPNERHALECVRAAIDAQQAIHALNRDRALENQRRQSGNAQRLQQGLPPLPLLKLLTMGSGINTGLVTVGLMGSERHMFNFTVFGREVNLAARLEGLSGQSRILIGQGTYRALLKDDPALGAACVELAPTTVKGFRTPAKIYEVPWQIAEATIVPVPAFEERAAA